MMILKVLMNYLFITFPVLAISYLLFGLKGPLLMLSVQGVLFIIFCFWGDKIILFQCGANKLRDDSYLIQNEILHNSFMLRMKRPAIYTADLDQCNVFSVRNIKGDSFIIIDNRVFNLLTANELRAALSLELVSLRDNEVTARMVNFLFNYIFYLFFDRAGKLFLKIGLRKRKETSLAMSNILFWVFGNPIIELSKKLIHSEERIYRNDQLAAEVYGQSFDLAGAILKLYSTQVEKVSFGRILSQLYIVDNTEESKILKIFNFSPSGLERYWRLLDFKIPASK